MTFGGVVMTIALIVTLLMIICPIICGFDDPGSFYMCSIGVVLLIFWIVFSAAGLKHSFNAKHYYNLLKTQSKMEAMAQKIPDPEIKQLYELELFNQKAKVEKVRDKMSVKDWVKYYTNYYKEEPADERSAI
jgi:hypothetical protein